jgi:hypothetical protein
MLAGLAPAGMAASFAARSKCEELNVRANLVRHTLLSGLDGACGHVADYPDLA